MMLLLINVEFMPNML